MSNDAIAYTVDDRPVRARPIETDLVAVLRRQIAEDERRKKQQAGPATEFAAQPDILNLTPSGSGDAQTWGYDTSSSTLVPRSAAVDLSAPLGGVSPNALRLSPSGAPSATIETPRPTTNDALDLARQIARASRAARSSTRAPRRRPDCPRFLAART